MRAWFAVGVRVASRSVRGEAGPPLMEQKVERIAIDAIECTTTIVRTMLISVENNNGLAIYEQIVRQIKFSVASGAIRVGEFIPSVRELAKQIAVNPNTVARAYRDLQSDGVLESVRGKGLQVTQKAPDLCRVERRSLIQHRLRAVLEEAHQSGLTRKELRALTQEELSRLNGKADA